MTIFTWISNIHESEIDLNGFYPVAAAAAVSAAAADNDDNDDKGGGT